jgi:hypothetical protein
MHPARLRCENSKYREYSCVFAPGRAGAYTPNSVNLFLRTLRFHNLTPGSHYHILVQGDREKN